VGLRYEPLFPYFAPLADAGAFVVVADGYVTDDSGTGVVHQVGGWRGVRMARCVWCGCGGGADSRVSEAKRSEAMA